MAGRSSLWKLRKYTKTMVNRMTVMVAGTRLMRMLRPFIISLFALLIWNQVTTLDDDSFSTSRRLLVPCAAGYARSAQLLPLWFSL
ncbi:hypothetical protein ACLKA6_015511 [Drosophila palustris]